MREGSDFVQEAQWNGMRKIPMVNEEKMHPSPVSSTSSPLFSVALPASGNKMLSVGINNGGGGRRWVVRDDGRHDLTQHHVLKAPVCCSMRPIIRLENASL
jgi:hypothetical protein